MGDRREDPVAHRGLPDAGAHGVDRPGELRAGHERRFGAHLVPAPDDERIGEVDPRRVHRHPDLAGTGFRLGQVADAQALRRAEGLGHDGAHPGPA